MTQFISYNNSVIIFFYSQYFRKYIMELINQYIENECHFANEYKQIILNLIDKHNPSKQKQNIRTNIT